MKAVLSRSLTGVFCDDIRQEMFGKLSLVGCYGSGLEALQFPVTLPKLCAYVQLKTPLSQPFGTQIDVVVYRDEEELVRGEIPVPPISEHLTHSEEDSLRVQQLVVQFVLSPLVLEGPCTLRVRAQVDGEELRGLALSVRAHSEAS